MFHIVHRHVHENPIDIADELEAIASFISYAVENENYTGDATARNGASLLVAAIAFALADLRTVTESAMKASEQRGYEQGVSDGRAAAVRAVVPDLTEPAASKTERCAKTA